MEKSLIGKKFGKLTVIEDAKKENHYNCLCKCDCGNTKLVKPYHLEKGYVKSCGCLGHYKDLTNQRFGRLTVIRIEKQENNKIYWLCKCDCGNEKVVHAGSLLKGCVKSCGCLKKEIQQIGNPKHKLYGTRIYRIWNAMKSRCCCPTRKAYKNYGMRGIKVCNEWKDNVESFYKWAIENGYQDNLTIDRIDNNGNYEPSNCRWVTMKTQQRNKSNNRTFFYKGETLTLSQICEKYNISYSTIQHRLEKNNDIVMAIEKPIDKTKQRYAPK